MADNNVSNERRKELEQLDPFQENLIKAIALAKEYKKQLILIAGALVLVIVIFSGIMYSFQKAENTASSRVSQALKTYSEANDPVEGYKQVNKEFEAIFKEYSNTTAGKMAKVQFGKICYDASKFDQSFMSYADALDIFKNDAAMEVFLLASLGHVSIARKEFDKAKSYFLKIENGSMELLKDEAKFTLALLDESSGNVSESKTRFETIVKEFETSIYNPIAKSKVDELN